jgi:CRP/FNR family transcriptional regulator
MLKQETARLAFEVVKTACSNCNLRELCLPDRPRARRTEEARRTGFDAQAPQARRSSLPCRAGLRVDLRIRSGFFKTDVLIEDGRDQVTGFQMTGELLGLDGISSEIHYL